MATRDTCCTIVPYFKVHAGQMDAFRALCERLVAKTSEEPECLYYGFSFNGDLVHCREGYVDAEAALTHLGRVGPLIQEALTISDRTRLEIHGPEAELAKLRGPLAGRNAEFFVLDYGFRR